MNLFVKNFPDDYHKKVKIKAVQMGLTLSNLITQIVKEWLRKEKSHGNQKRKRRSEGV